MNKNKFLEKDTGSENLIKFILFFMVCTLIYFSFEKYTLFHTIIEIFIVCVGVSIGLIAINSYNYYKNTFFIIIAISFLFTGIINIMHIIAYINFSCSFKLSSNTMREYSQNIYMQLSMAQNYMTIITFIVANKLLNKNINLLKIGFTYIIATMTIYVFIYVLDILPICYYISSGVTKFKYTSDFILILLAVYCLFLLKVNKKHFKNIIYVHLSVYIVLFILYNFINIILLGVLRNLHIQYMVSNCIYHCLKFLSFCVIYDVFVKTTLKYPYESIFNEINKKAYELKRLNDILNIKNAKLRESKMNIRKSKIKYKKFLEWIPDAILIREDGKIIYANNAFINMFKIKDKREILNKELIAILPKEYTEILKRRVKKLKEYETIPFRQEKLFAIDGEEIDAEICSMSIDLYGKENRINIIRNLEDRKKYERLSLELEEKDNLRIEFFANICHELRTPVNVIYSALQLEDRYIEERNIQFINKYNKIVKHNCYRLLRLCNNLIDLSKIDSGFVEPNVKVYNVVQIIENITMSVVPYANVKKLEIVFDTNDEEIYMACDISFMERIILNLLSNAIKFSVEDGCIWVNIKQCKNEIQISIKDNGIGIEKNKQKFIFERFMQADKSFSRNSEGSGIGLSLVKSFVELQGGKIYCYSIKGKGTEFVIKFPFEDKLEQNMVNREFQQYASSNNVCVEFSDIYFN